MKRSNTNSSVGFKKQRSYEEDEPSYDEDFASMDEVLFETVEGADQVESSENQESRWSRPAKFDLDVSKDNLAFHWLDIDMTSGSPMDENPDGGKVIGSQDGPVPILRMYGVTSGGQSVIANIHGFTPYFYVSFPTSIELSDSLLGQLRFILDQRCREKARGEEKNLKKYVLGVDKTNPMQSLLGYHFEEIREFVKIYVAMPSLIAGVKRLLEDGVQINGVGALRGQTYESNVPFVLRFMIDNDISGADWVELPAGTYALSKNFYPQSSRCSLEVDVFFNNITPHPCTGQWSSIAPVRILSFDIECQGRKGHFPDAAFDPVIQIANTVTLQGSDHSIIRNVFTLNTCLPIVGAQVICCATEDELLMRWRAFVNACDPDIITGYNIANFDIPYLLNRAKVRSYRQAKYIPFIYIAVTVSALSIVLLF